MKHTIVMHPEMLAELNGYDSEFERTLREQCEVTVSDTIPPRGISISTTQADDFAEAMWRGEVGQIDNFNFITSPYVPEYTIFKNKTVTNANRPYYRRGRW